MRKLTIQTIVLLLFGVCFTARAQEQDKLLQLLKEELRYNMAELQKQDLPPYYMNFRAMDDYSVNIVSNFGAIAGSTAVRSRRFVPQIRLGSPELDNFKYTTQGAAPDARGQQSSQGAFLPLDSDSPAAVRDFIWREILKRYEFARQQYEAVRTKASVSVEDEDKAPCFSSSPVEKYYESPLKNVEQMVDIRAWEQRLNEVSAAFKSTPELQGGSATLVFQAYRTWFVNTEGTEIVQNRVSARVMLSASVKASDGMELPLNMDYFAYSPDQLPDNSRLISDAHDMARRLLALREAPVADPYTGPAILSGPASGVFFHEIFGHRLEGHRLKTGGQTFKKMVGEQVLPADFQVYCDPTLRHYAGTDMNGHYVYDDEGGKSRRVDNVVNGVLKEFLMSRVPLDGFPSSNSHGRTSGGGDPVSRQSNLIIETSRPHTDAELRTLLIAEAKKQGKDYGYFFNTVTSGFTYTGEGGSLNSFNVTPLEVYRVYVDGRPDELVRGVDMIGTPLSMFSNIAAAGDKPAVFTGMCGAESGWVPVTACSPMIFVSQVETQRRSQSRDIPPLLPVPETKGKLNGTDDEIIFGAMGDELNRNLHQLALPGEQTPFYLSYVAARYRTFQVMASLGSLLYTTESPWGMVGGVQVVLGDYDHNSELQYSGGQVGAAPIAAEVDYDAIRRGLWGGSDAMYRYALQALQQKSAYLQNNPLPAADAALPDMQQLPAVTRIVERTEPYEIDLPSLEKLISEASSVFREYPDLYKTSLNLTGTQLDIYRLTSEGVRLKFPEGNVNLQVSASVRASDGSVVSGSTSVTELTPGALPSADALQKQIRDFADGLMRLKDAPAVDEYYIGPVLFENGAAAKTFIDNLFPKGRLLALRKLPPAQGLLDQLMGRKVIDSRLTIKNYTSLKEYNNTPLFGHYEIDGDGVVPPEELTLVDRGIFKQMLNGRFPALKAPASTGSARFLQDPNKPMVTTSPGTVHIQADKGMKPESMKKALLKAAKEQGLAYAYIVRSINGGASLIYRVNVKDGKETQMRASSLQVPDLMKLMDLKGISSKENVMNFLPNSVPASLIYPSGIIVNDVEINKATPKIEKEPVIVNPAKRQAGL